MFHVGSSRRKDWESTVALNETTKGREEEREREGKTRGPHSWLLYRHEVRPRWPRLGEGQRGGRSEESVGLPHSRDGRPSLEGVGGTRVAILRSSGCKTCQNLTGSPPPRLSIPPHWVTTRILSISIRNSLESLPWKIKAFPFFYYYYAWKFNDEVIC